MITQARKPKRMVMFPSDLQGTHLEDVWVNGYDSTLEENQDRFMEDFWEWSERKCTYKIEKQNEHTIFVFEGDLITFI